jgi:hypothetical protein
MGEGLGAGGHSTRRCSFNARSAPPVPACEIIFGLSCAACAAAAARVRDAQHRPAGRHACHPEIRDIANGCEEHLGRPRGPRSHSGSRPGTGWAGHLRTPTCQNPPRKQQPLVELAATNARPPRQFRDDAAFGHDFCESLWTTRSPDPTALRDLPCSTAAWRRSSAEARAAGAQRSKPLSWASDFREVSGRAPRCWITSAATNAARRAAVR